jgi:hypothetical protein
MLPTERLLTEAFQIAGHRYKFMQGDEALFSSYNCLMFYIMRMDGKYAALFIFKGGFYSLRNQLWHFSSSTGQQSTMCPSAKSRSTDIIPLHRQSHAENAGFITLVGHASRRSNATSASNPLGLKHDRPLRTMELAGQIELQSCVPTPTAGRRQHCHSFLIALAGANHREDNLCGTRPASADRYESIFYPLRRREAEALVGNDTGAWPQTWRK